LESGFLLSAAGLVAGLGNFAFQAMVTRLLRRAGQEIEYGYLNPTLSFVQFLGLPLAVATYTVTHFIARFSAGDQSAHLQGLIAGCRKFLFRLTVAGSVLAAVALKPLSDFFHFPRSSLMLVALSCVLASLWGSFATALCQGLAWFKRLALIGMLGVLLRLTFGGVMLPFFPVAEAAAGASGVALLANLVLLYWRRDLAVAGAAVSPWNREFVQYLIVSAACIGGGYSFTQSDLLVAQRYFSGPEFGGTLAAYSAAGVLARALPMAVAPLLTVLFTHRSGAHKGSPLHDQLKYLCFYGAGLACGDLCLVVLRDIWVRILLGRPGPESASMIGRLATAMVFAGLLQALGLWALASRWLKLALLYGALGLAYWLTLLCLGKSPADLLWVMPSSAGAAFAVLFVAWLFAMRASRVTESEAG
jgi:hypothetical protein